MKPRKNFHPSSDRDDRDRDGPDSGVNQVNPHETPRTSGRKSDQGGDPSEVRPQVRQPNRDKDSDDLLEGTGGS